MSVCGWETTLSDGMRGWRNLAKGPVASRSLPKPTVQHEPKLQMMDSGVVVLDAPGAGNALAVVDDIYSPINWERLKSSAPHGQIEYFSWLSVLIRYLRIMGVSRDHLKQSGAVLCQRRFNVRNTLGVEASEPVEKAKKKRRDSRVVVSDKYKVFPALLLTHGCEADGEELGEKMLKLREKLQNWSELMMMLDQNETGSLSPVELRASIMAFSSMGLITELIDLHPIDQAYRPWQTYIPKEHIELAQKRFDKQPNGKTIKLHKPYKADSKGRAQFPDFPITMPQGTVILLGEEGVQLTHPSSWAIVFQFLWEGAGLGLHLAEGVDAENWWRKAGRDQDGAPARASVLAQDKQAAARASQRNVTGIPPEDDDAKRRIELWEKRFSVLVSSYRQNAIVAKMGTLAQLNGRQEEDEREALLELVALLDREAMVHKLKIKAEECAVDTEKLHDADKQSKRKSKKGRWKLNDDAVKKKLIDLIVAAKGEKLEERPDPTHIQFFFAPREVFEDPVDTVPRLDKLTHPETFGTDQDRRMTDPIKLEQGKWYSVQIQGERTSTASSSNEVSVTHMTRLTLRIDDYDKLTSETQLRVQPAGTWRVALSVDFRDVFSLGK
eukprot:COSAG04_NODE_16_length_40397_cov_59.653677_18_plen_610_part_00